MDVDQFPTTVGAIVGLQFQSNEAEGMQIAKSDGLTYKS